MPVGPCFLTHTFSLPQLVDFNFVRSILSGNQKTCGFVFTNLLRMLYNVALCPLSPVASPTTLVSSLRSSFARTFVSGNNPTPSVCLQTVEPHSGRLLFCFPVVSVGVGFPSALCFPFVLIQHPMGRGHVLVKMCPALHGLSPRMVPDLKWIFSPGRAWICSTKWRGLLVDDFWCRA